jgi:hypothetical protein
VKGGESREQRAVKTRVQEAGLRNYRLKETGNRKQETGTNPA